MQTVDPVYEQATDSEEVKSWRKETKSERGTEGRKKENLEDGTTNAIDYAPSCRVVSQPCGIERAEVELSWYATF